jgi:sec-independent protein translocase protein TatA
MPHVGIPELLVIFMILLLVFGGSRLPQIGEGVGKAIRGFKRGLASDDAIEVTEPKPGSAAKGATTGDSTPTDADVVEKS